MALFNLVSSLSTTGYATVDYRDWVGLGWLVLIAFMLVGGGTGFIAGGDQAVPHSRSVSGVGLGVPP